MAAEAADRTPLVRSDSSPAFTGVPSTPEQQAYPRKPSHGESDHMAESSAGLSSNECPGTPSTAEGSIEDGVGAAQPPRGAAERSRSEPSSLLSAVPAESFTASQQQVTDEEAAMQPGSRLDCEWTIWFDKSNRRARQGKGGRAIYDDCIVELGSFDTVQGFWAYWDSLHVQNLKDHCNLRVFKKGVKPLWEDAQNRDGGKWVVRGVNKLPRKNLWTRMITALITGTMQIEGSSVCGSVLSTRDDGDSMQLWVSSLPMGVGAQAAEEAVAHKLTQMLCDEGINDLRFVYQTHLELQQKRGAPPPTQMAPPAQIEAPLPMALQGCASIPQECGWQLAQCDVQPPMEPAPPSMPGVIPGMTLPSGAVMAAIPQAPMGGAPPFPPPLPPQQNVYPPPPPPPSNAPRSPMPPQHMSPPPPHGSEAPQWGGDDGDDMSVMVPEGVPQSDEVRAIQARAKQIRTIRKKIRYVNFFLARQGKGRPLTEVEQQRVKSLPFLQRELQLLEEQQAREVETQKLVLGVDSLDFLRKPQQPMTYSTEAERRFKQMRAIRKKIRFIHYHLERQRQGKVLSPAEVAKVTSLAEFERMLAALEAEEEEAQQHQQQAPQPPAAPEMAPPAYGFEPSREPGCASPTWPSPPQGPAMSPPAGAPPPEPLPPPQCAQNVAADLRKQIEQQKRELVAKQHHIEQLLNQQPSQMPSGYQQTQYRAPPRCTPLSPQHVTHHAPGPVSPMPQSPGLPPSCPSLDNSLNSPAFCPSPQLEPQMSPQYQQSAHC